MKTSTIIRIVAWVIFISACLITALSFGQAPQFFNYQANVRTASGIVVSYKNVSFDIYILQGGCSGNIIYEETQTAKTSDMGIVNLQIGNGAVKSGSMSAINWGGGLYFIKIAFDISGGTNYMTYGCSQLVSVPYALYAKTSGTQQTFPYAVYKAWNIKFMDSIMKNHIWDTVRGRYVNTGSLRINGNGF